MSSMYEVVEVAERYGWSGEESLASWLQHRLSRLADFECREKAHYERNQQIARENPVGLALIKQRPKEEK